ncbi:Villin-4 [Hordeum vulgare]|nr:Villin-4 [Hordeum vulgare]
MLFYGHSCVFIWPGQHVDTKIRAQALSIGERFLELYVLTENLQRETPLYAIIEGSKHQYFTMLITGKSAKPKRRPTPSSHTGRYSIPDRSQGRTTSCNPEHARVRGTLPAFNALAANFENLNA